MIGIIQNKKVSFTISGIVFVASIAIMLIFGFNTGIDFTGGSLMEITFNAERPSTAEVQESVAHLDLGKVTIQSLDEDAMLLRMRFLNEDEHQQVLGAIRESFAVEEVEGNAPPVREDRFETIGPAISSQLKNRSISAAIAVMLAIILYVGYAFRKVSKPVASWKYGLTAIIAVVHDVVITLAIISLLGRYAGVEIDIPTVVALLTILGYSVNDTIVVFDRVRENLIKRGSSEFAETVNIGVNETIIRSINTSLTTLFVLGALYVFGGESIKHFSLTLIVGIVLGTYSSIFLASPLLVVWEEMKKRRV